MKKTIKVQSNISEKQLMEILLNMKCSGISQQEVLFILGFHALVNSWRINKLIYYNNLLEDLK